MKNEANSFCFVLILCCQLLQSDVWILLTSRAGISSQKRIDIIAIFFGRIDIFKRYIGKFQIPFFMMNVTAKSIKNMST